MTDIENLIKETFYPDPYSSIEDDLGVCKLHLSRVSLATAKYVLLVCEISETSDITSIIKDHKIRLKQYYNASFLKGVGVLVFFIGKHEYWKNQVSSANPDWHGLQSVILQGVLFLDDESKKFELLQSHWGPFKFGNFQGQMDKVHYILGKIGA